MADEHAGTAATEEPKSVDTSDLDDQIVEIDRNTAQPKQKHVPLSAVVDERRQRKQLQDRLTALEAENQEARAYIERAEPIIAPLRNDEQKYQQVQAVLSGTKPSAGQGETSKTDAEAAQFAEDMELLDREGKPDVARARRILDKLDARASGAAARVVAPVARSLTGSQATSVRAADYQHLLDRGVPKETIDAIYTQLPDDVLATPGMSNLVRTLVLGQATANGVKLDRPAPIVTEAAGGRGALPDAPSEAGSYMRERLGKSEAEWNKLREAKYGVAGIELE